MFVLQTICIALLFSFYVNTRTEYYTAVAELEYLLETHKRVTDDLESYIEAEQERLSILKRYLNMFKAKQEAMENVPNYVGNPMNAFTLIKGLTVDLNDIKYNMDRATEYKVSYNNDDLKFPSSVDLEGAAQGIARLQKVYNLDTTQLAQGKLNSASHSSPMTAGDCYELSHALMFKQARLASEWMVEALRKYYEERVSYPFNDVDIMAYISLAYYLSGDTKKGLRWSQNILELEDEHQIPKDYQRYNDIFSKLNLSDIQKKNEDDVDEKGFTFNRNPVMKVYEHLCRGEISIPPGNIEKVKKTCTRLSCRYMTENHPFLKIAPIKMETLNVNPEVVLFHNVLNDNEIETIKQLARPRLKRAVVFSNNNSIVGYRIGKASLIVDQDSQIIAKVSRRVMHMTGLSIDTAEPLQAINYGVGGHYEPHYDFTKDGIVKFVNGNRIATVMFYMSDVALGGATVFPWLGLNVYPVKGSAMFWLNLHASGEGNLLTLHAACPVLLGSKWVATKWLHVSGQELLKLCSLEYNDTTTPKLIPDFILDVMNL